MKKYLIDLMVSEQNYRAYMDDIKEFAEKNGYRCSNIKTRYKFSIELDGELSEKIFRHEFPCKVKIFKFIEE